MDPLTALADRLDPPHPKVRWSPQDKQAIASGLTARTDELLYGGAAGGGKSYWLVQHAVDEMLAHPGNRGVIFRRVFPSLNRTIVPRIRDVIRGHGTYNETIHEVRFANGSLLELSTLQRAGDVERYQGAEYGVVAFEELTEFLESQWLFLIGRLRAPVDGVRPHAIATTNPGGVGHRWVKRRFVAPEAVDLEPGATPPAPLQVWRPRATEENSTGDSPPLSRCFVPATLDDNPALTRRDPHYRARLRANTSRAKRKALELGDWDAIDAVEGALWEQSWLDAGRVDTSPPSRRRVLAVDPSDGNGGGDGYGVCVASVGTDGRGYVEATAAWRKPVARMIDDTVALAREVGADRIIVERNHGGAFLVEAFRSRHPNVRIETVWASDKKRTRAEPVSVLFEPIDEAEPRAVLVGNHPELEESMTTFTGDPAQPSPDVLDACLIAGTAVATPLGEVPIEDIRPGDLVWTRAGWRPVEAVRCTARAVPVGTVRMSNGRQLVGTPDHLVWASGVWKRLDAVVWGDRLNGWTIQQASSSPESPTSGIRSRPSGPIGSTTRRRDGAAEDCCIGTSGRRSTAPSRTAITSTTLTATRSTTTSPTSPWSHPPNTYITTPAMSSRDGRGQQRSGHSHPHGTAAKPASLGTANMANGPGTAGCRTWSRAWSAVFKRPGTTPDRPGVPSALADALAGPPTANTATNSRSHAQSAGRCSGSPNTGPNLSPAPVNALGSYVANGTGDVYDIQVAGEHEFLAEGVIVHNCVWALTELMVGPTGQGEGFATAWKRMAASAAPSTPNPVGGAAVADPPPPPTSPRSGAHRR